MDPLFKLTPSESPAPLSAGIVSSLKDRMKFVRRGIERVERVSSLRYPPYYVEPLLPMISSEVEFGQLGLMFARTIPMDVGGVLKIWIQLTAPLILFGSKSTIEAVLAHEFLHYFELVRRFSKMQTISVDVSTTIFEAKFADYELLYDAERLFKGRALPRLLRQRLSEGLFDKALTSKTLKRWVEKGLPVAKLPPEDNVTRISIASLLKADFDPAVRKRLDELEPKRPS